MSGGRTNARKGCRLCVQCCKPRDNEGDLERCVDCHEYPGPARFDGETGARLDGLPSYVRRSMLVSGLGEALESA